MDETIRFRPALTEDADALVGFDSVAAVDDGARAVAIDRWLRSGATRVAELNEWIAGYCVVEPTFFGHDFVTMVMVALDARGLGIGALLLDDAVRHRSTAKMFASTNLGNQPMQRLLSRSGWRSAGIVYGLDDGDPELIFQAPDQ